MSRFAPLAAILLLIAGLAPRALRAHEIPRHVAVQAFLKPEGQRLHLLLRVPLEAMRDVDIPLRGPGFLDIARADEPLQHAARLWILAAVDVREGDRPLEGTLTLARASLPSDGAFASYESARTHLAGTRLPASTEIPWAQAMLDVHVEYPIASETSSFSIRPDFTRLGMQVSTILRFLPAAGGVRAFHYRGDPGMVRLDPRWHQAAWHFVTLGFEHILDGADHLLFLMCLVIPLRKLRPLVLVVTAFTAAHSVTLIASAYDLAPSALWFPPLIETLIAGSIVYMALENIVSAAPARSRWVMAFAFGLVHGFGFSFGLRDTLQFAGAHLLTSLLSFNLGVELGQLLVLLLLVPALHVLFRLFVAERMGVVVVSALVAHTAWHWTADRWHSLRQFSIEAPEAAALATFLRWLLAGAVVFTLFQLAHIVRSRVGVRFRPTMPSTGGGKLEGAND